jgi:hypothetical protein
MPEALLKAKNIKNSPANAVLFEVFKYQKKAQKDIKKQPKLCPFFRKTETIKRTFEKQFYFILELLFFMRSLQRIKRTASDVKLLPRAF